MDQRSKFPLCLYIYITHTYIYRYISSSFCVSKTDENENVECELKTCPSIAFFINDEIEWINLKAFKMLSIFAIFPWNDDGMKSKM